MGRRTRECYLCGQNYQYCPTCTQDRTKPSWMSEFHSESCKNIFDICTRFNMGTISKEDAQRELNSCDLTNKSNFKSYVQRDLDAIFYEEPIVAEVEAKIEEVEMIVDLKPRKPAKKSIHEVVTQDNE